MFKKWIARLIIPVLAVVALCPLGAQQATAAEPAWLEAYSAQPEYGNITVNTMHGSYEGYYLSQETKGDWIEVAAWPNQWSYFKGWYEVGTGYVSSYPVYDFNLWDDTEIYAEFGQIPQHLVFINKNGASGYMEDPYIPEGDTYTVPYSEYTPPEGTYFNGWYLEGVGTVWPGYTLTITEDIELVAQWEDIYYTVYIMPNGGSGWVPDPQFKYGTTYELPECPFDAPWGMKFDGWDLGDPGDEIDLYSDITINAQWVNKMCTVYIMPNGGGGWVPDPQFEVGTEYTLPACEFTAPDGYRFDGWDLGKPGEVIKLDGDVTINAQWAKEDAKPEPAPAPAPTPVSSGSASAASGSGSASAASGSASAASPTAGGNGIGTDPGAKKSGEFPIIPVLLGIIAAALIAIVILLLVRRNKDNDEQGAHERRE